jgi:hypothetical protein
VRWRKIKGREKGIQETVGEMAEDLRKRIRNTGNGK